MKPSSVVTEKRGFLKLLSTSCKTGGWSHARAELPERVVGVAYVGQGEGEKEPPDGSSNVPP